MKFLQIHNTSNNEPRILELGTDRSYMSDMGKGLAIYDQYYWDEIIFDSIVPLSNCYQQRPLIEIDGWCEFDVHVIARVPYLCSFPHDTCRYIQENGEIKYDLDGDHIANLNDNIGSIFTPENKLTYPELYQQALEIIQD